MAWKCSACGYPNPDDLDKCFKCEKLQRNKEIDQESAQNKADDIPDKTDDKPSKSQQQTLPVNQQSDANGCGCLLAIVLCILVYWAFFRTVSPETSVTATSSNRSNVLSAFTRWRSVAENSPEAKQLFTDINLDDDVPTIRVTVSPNIWYQFTEYDKRKLTEALWSTWGGCLREAGIDESQAIIRLYDDTSTCIARGASFGIEIYH